MSKKQARPISQNLANKSGRHTNVTKENHLCKLVLNIKNSDSNILRKNYWGKSSVYKVIQLLSVQNYKELCNLGKYLQLALITAMAFHNFFSAVLLCLYYIADTVPYIM